MTIKLENSESHANSEKGTETTQSADSGFLDMQLPPISKQIVYHDDDKGETVSDTPEEAKTDTFEVDQTASTEYRGMLDDKGVSFDPTIHTAPPEKTPSGRWKRIPKNQREKISSGDVEIEPNASNRKEAQKAALMYASLHGLIFPEDCAPNPDNLTSLIDSVEQYYNENGAIELPAGVNLAMAAGMYSQEIATRPTNLQKVKNWISKVVTKAKEKRNKIPTKKEAEKKSAELIKDSEKKEAT